MTPRQQLGPVGANAAGRIRDKGQLRGHQDAFLWPRLDARYRFNQRTFAATRGNERDAP